VTNRYYLKRRVTGNLIKKVHLDFMSLSGAIGKGLAYWFIAGIIVAALSLLFAWATGGLIGAFGEIIIDVILQPLFFPFDLIVGWSLNPIAVILQVIFFACLLYLFEK
jgi:hypothetical protein